MAKCSVIHEFQYHGIKINVGAVIDIPDGELWQYKQFLDCSVSGSGKTPKPEEPPIGEE